MKRVDLLDNSFILLKLFHQYWYKLATIFHNAVINLFKHQRLGGIIDGNHQLGINQAYYMLDT